MTVRLVSLFPEHLNLNGDQANLLVASKRLEWFGYESEIVSVGMGEDIPDGAHLIFLGHGSLAAWNYLSADLERLVPQIRNSITQGSGFMAIASGYEKAIRLGFFGGDLSAKKRVSKFEVVNLGNLEVLGYLNSTTKAPVIQKDELSLGSQLHGPLFAKNPDLVDSYLAEILAAKNYSVAKKQEKNNLDQVAEIIEAVWSLERELARE
jgi:CobQ-like glutamine amidotransferase family enzyme